MKADFIALAGRTKHFITDLEAVVKRVDLLVSKARNSGDDCYYDGAALNLHGFYSGVERIFEDIARTVDKSLPKGEEWHQGLVLQMSADIPSIRPSVITRETRDLLDEYRGFRHVVRNVYAFRFRPSRIEELAAGLEGCFIKLKADLTVFCDYLEEVGAD